MQHHASSYLKASSPVIFAGSNFKWSSYTHVLRLNQWTLKRLGILTCLGDYPNILYILSTYLVLQDVTCQSTVECKMVRDAKRKGGEIIRRFLDKKVHYSGNRILEL